MGSIVVLFRYVSFGSFAIDCCGFQLNWLGKNDGLDVSKIYLFKLRLFRWQFNGFSSNIVLFTFNSRKTFFFEMNENSRNYYSFSPSMCLHLVVVREFVYLNDPESYVDGSIATGRATFASNSSKG